MQDCGGALELSVSNAPLTIGGPLSAVAVAQAGTLTPGPFLMRSVVTPVAEAGTLTPRSFRMWSVVGPVAETIVAVPLVVRVRVPVIVLVPELATPIVAMPLLLALVCAFSSSAGVTSHSGAVHREAIHLSAVAGPYAATMGTTTAVRPRTRAAQQYFGEADDADDDQRFCRHDSIQDDENASNTNCSSIIAAPIRDCDNQVDQERTYG